MEKKQITYLISDIYRCYPEEFNKMNKQQKLNYINIFYKEFVKYDFDLVINALHRILKQNYSKSPTIEQLKIYVSRLLFERVSEVFLLMYNNGFYRRNLSGTEEEIKEIEVKTFFRVSEDLIKYQLTLVNKNEIINAPDKYDYLSKYKGLILFDDSLPIPPGCGPKAKC